MKHKLVWLSVTCVTALISAVMYVTVTGMLRPPPPDRETPPRNEPVPATPALHTRTDPEREKAVAALEAERQRIRKEWQAHQKEWQAETQRHREARERCEDLAKREKAFLDKTARHIELFLLLEPQEQVFFFTAIHQAKLFGADKLNQQQLRLLGRAEIRKKELDAILAGKWPR